MEIVAGFIHAVIVTVIVAVLAAIVFLVLGLAIIGGLWILIVHDWRRAPR